MALSLGPFLNSDNRTLAFHFHVIHRSMPKTLLLIRYTQKKDAQYRVTLPALAMTNLIGRGWSRTKFRDKGRRERGLAELLSETLCARADTKSYKFCHEQEGGKDGEREGHTCTCLSSSSIRGSLSESISVSRLYGHCCGRHHWCTKAVNSKQQEGKFSHQPAAPNPLIICLRSFAH